MKKAEKAIKEKFIASTKGGQAYRALIFNPPIKLIGSLGSPALKRCAGSFASLDGAW